MIFKILKSNAVYIYSRWRDPSLTTYYKKQGVEIGRNCSFIGKINFGSEPYLIKIGNDVRVSFEVSFITHDGGTHVLRKKYPNAVVYGNISVGNNVFIGAKSIIMPNVHIGNNCIIGAGSIVTKNVPDNSVYAGVPAKKICSIIEYENKHFDNLMYIADYPFDKKKQILINHFTYGANNEK